jgi:hypothetical protein
MKMRNFKWVPGILALSALAFLFVYSYGQDFSRYEALKDPQINQMPNQRMFIVEATGDPNVVGKDAFSLLYRTFFSLPGVKMVAPRARWFTPLTAPKNEWKAQYGLPLPDSVTSLPPDITGVKIETWEYGEVAEILHLGPYSEETPTIQKLHKFIQEKGYEIAGPHEEEYLKGPGFVANPADYWTIIRYQVKKK